MMSACDNFEADTQPTDDTRAPIVVNRMGL